MLEDRMSRMRGRGEDWGTGKEGSWEQSLLLLLELFGFDLIFMLLSEAAR